jgi:hypothetical protein
MSRRLGVRAACVWHGHLAREVYGHGLEARAALAKPICRVFTRWRFASLTGLPVPIVGRRAGVLEMVSQFACEHSQFFLVEHICGDLLLHLSDLPLLTDDLHLLNDHDQE